MSNVIHSASIINQTCRCLNKCQCMDMKCDSCCVSGIQFHASTVSLPNCLCRQPSVQYAKSDVCICYKSCLCKLYDRH